MRPTTKPKVSDIERLSKFHYSAGDITKYYGKETKKDQDVYFIKNKYKDFKERITQYIEKGIKKNNKEKLEHGDIIFVGISGKLGQDGGFVIVNLFPNVTDKFIFTDSFVTHGDDDINIHEFDKKFCNNVWKKIDFKEAIVEIIRWKKGEEGQAIYWHTE